MAPFVESLSNKPSPASLCPIASLFLLSASAKVRIAGRLLATDLDSGWLLLGSHDRQAAVWVDHVGEEGTLAGVVGKEGKGSCWMALGDLEEVQVRVPSPSLLSSLSSTGLVLTPSPAARSPSLPHPQTSL